VKHFARARHAAALALLLVAPLVGAAEEKPQATGKFEGKQWTFEAYGAYAFPAEDIGMDDQPGIRVAISNSGFATETMDRYWDREHVIDEFHRDEETLVVYFDFAKDGKYKGMTYSFGSGDGCGYCYDGSVQSTVKIEKGRIRGGLKLAAEPGEVSFDLTFDVPVAPTDYGTPLPAGGGEQGKVYAAYHAALNGDSPDAVRAFLDADDAAALKEHGAEFIDGLRDDHPTESYKIVKGFTNGDRALLVVEGATSIMNIETEVHLLRIDGTWRVYNEISQVKLGG
jgi:hypothetical protein